MFEHVPALHVVHRTRTHTHTQVFAGPCVMLYVSVHPLWIRKKPASGPAGTHASSALAQTAAIKP